MVCATLPPPPPPPPPPGTHPYAQPSKGASEAQFAEQAPFTPEILGSILATVRS
jgi:hypothetical protein